VVKLCVEHSDDLAALIVDDGLVLLVPKHRNRKAADIIRVCLAVQVTHFGEAIKRIFGICAFAAIEYPTIFRQLEPADDKLNERFKAFQRPNDIGAVRPGTAPVIRGTISNDFSNWWVCETNEKAGSGGRRFIKESE
jgi:hypothetical protein